MYIFSRRAIQHCLDDLRGAIPPTQLRELADRLNQPGGRRLTDVWEVAVLRSFSRVGQIVHEATLGNGRKPDLAFSFPGDDQVGFIADITAVADTGPDEANPVQVLSDEIARLARKARVNPNRLHIEVRGVATGRPAHARLRLLLPGLGDLPALLKATVVPFLNKVKRDPAAEHRVDVNSEGVSFSLAYKHTQSLMTMNYPAYNITLSLRKNPLRKRLDAKVDQLKGVPAGVLKGIIACDAGCRMLSAKWKGLQEFNTDEVIRDFLRQNASFGFVLVLTVEQTNRSVHTPEYRIVGKLWSSRTALNDRRLRALVKEVIWDLPRPVLDALNSSIQCRSADYGIGYLGGFGMGSGRDKQHVRIPARALLELLSGRMEPAQFRDVFGWRDSGGPGREHENPFERLLSQGRLITRVRVEPGRDDSDDWLSFEFGEPDPAISPFVIKQEFPD